MDESRFLVVLLSPSAAASPWVNREVSRWLEAHGSANVLLALCNGELVWSAECGGFDAATSTAAPPALTEPDVFKSVPLFVDLRFTQSIDHVGLDNAALRDAIITLAAPLHGRSKDELGGDDQRELRRFRRYRRGAIAGLMLLSVVSVIAAVVAILQRTEASAGGCGASPRARCLVDRRAECVSIDRAGCGGRAGNGSPTSSRPQRRNRASLQRLLSMPLRRSAPSSALPGGSNLVAWSPDDSLLAAGNTDGDVRVFDAANGRQRGEDISDRDPDLIGGLVWSPDGSRLASRNLDDVVIRDAYGRPLHSSFLPGGPIEWTRTGGLKCREFAVARASSP